MVQNPEYYKDYISQPGKRAQASARVRAWVKRKCSTAEGRAEFNAAQLKRKKKRVQDPLRWPRHALHHAKARAKRRSLPFDIQPCDLVVPETCPVLGTPFVCGAGYKDMRSPSLDRIKPELGYVKGNVRIISLRANTLRNDATADELMKVALDAAQLERL